MEDEKLSRDFKEEALKALKGQYLEAMFAAIIATLLGVQTMATNFFPASMKEKKFEDLIPFEVPRELVGTVVVFVLIALIGFSLISFIINTGYAKYNYDLVNSKSPSIGVLFKYFKHAKNSIVANFYVFIIVFLWTLFLIIPGVVAAFSYAMVPFILAENPDLAPVEVLELSKKMMKGNRWRYFWLALSFIGWIIVCAFTFGIGYIFLAPYVSATQACFYKEISKKYEENLNRNKSNVRPLTEEDILFNKKDEDAISFNGDDFRI